MSALRLGSAIVVRVRVEVTIRVEVVEIVEVVGKSTHRGSVMSFKDVARSTATIRACGSQPIASWGPCSPQVDASAYIPRRHQDHSHRVQAAHFVVLVRFRD